MLSLTGKSHDSFFSKALGLADCRKDPEAWNRKWETLMLNRSLGQKILQMSLDQMGPGLKDPNALEEMMTFYRSSVRDLCDIQQRLTTNTARSFAIDDFESKWLKASLSQRQKHLLEGLVRTCTMVPGMEENRTLCEETTLANLQNNGGRGFLGLLKKFMLEDPSSLPTTPIILPHPYRRNVAQRDPTEADSEGAIHAYFDVQRNIFLCYLLFNTLASFHGYAEQPMNLKKGPHRNRTDATLRKRMAELVGKSTAKLADQQEKRDAEFLVITCETCEKSGKGISFKVCSACNTKLNRRIYYCSSKCQKVDWVPRHKVICGKTLNLKDAETSAVGSKPDPGYRYAWEDPVLSGEAIGPAVGGYKRSPALIHQIELIGKTEGLDYCIFIPGSSVNFFAVVIPGNFLLQKVMFRQIRDDAMTTGNPEAIAAIGQYLGKMVAQTKQCSKADVMNQLRNEYGFDVGSAVAELDKWSALEADGLSRVEVEAQGFIDFGKALYTDPALAEERDQMAKEVLNGLVLKRK